MIKIDTQTHVDALEYILSIINAYDINGLKLFIAERLLVEELKESYNDVILSVNRAYGAETDREDTDDIPYVVMFAGYPTAEYPDGYNPTKGFLRVIHQYNQEDMKRKRQTRDSKY